MTTLMFWAFSLHGGGFDGYNKKYFVLSPEGSGGVFCATGFLLCLVGVRLSQFPFSSGVVPRSNSYFAREHLTCNMRDKQVVFNPMVLHA